MNSENLLLAYTFQEQSRELGTQSRLLRWRAQRALYRSKKLRQHAEQLHERYGRLVYSLQGIGKGLE